MKTAFAITMSLICAQWALAQSVHLPLENIGGSPVAAHYVRLEGVGQQISYGTLRFAQQSCAKLGRHVDLPPEGAPITKMTREDYYTATHLIEFTRIQTLLITSDCVLKWQDLKPKLNVHHPYGVCKLDLTTKIALGHCDGTTSGTMIPLPTLPQEVLGMDRTRSCVKTATQVGRLRSVQCVQRPSESWRSFLYRAGADRQGLILEDRGTMEPNNEVLRDIRAVEVRKNITVGSDILDLARTQGFTINPGSGGR